MTSLKFPLVPSSYRFLPKSRTYRKAVTGTRPTFRPICEIVFFGGNVGTVGTIGVLPRNTASTTGLPLPRRHLTASTRQLTTIPRCSADPNGSSVRHFEAKLQTNSTLWRLDFPAVYPMGGTR